MAIAIIEDRSSLACNLVYDPVTLSWVRETQPAASGGPATIVDQGTSPWVVSLPSGASTATKQDTGNTSLASILTALDVALSTRASQATLASVLTAIQGALTVTGPLTDTQLRAAAVPVSGPLTDAQMRATAVPVSGTVTATGPLTDTQLRASAVPVSAASLPLPSGAATETTLAAIKAKTDNLDVALSTRTKAADQQHVIVDSSASIAVTGPLTDAQLRASAVPVSAASLPLPSGAATEATLAAVKTGTDKIPASPATEGGNLATIAGKDFATQTTLALIKAKTDNLDVALSTRTKPADVQHVDDNAGSLTVDGTVTANAGTGPWPVTDNGGSLTVDGSVGISGAVDTELTTADLDTGAGTDTRAVVGLVLAESGGGLLVGSAHPVPVSAASLPLPAGASTEATLAAIKTDVDKIPASPATDRTTAGGPFSVELSDGSAFYTGAKTGQLPTALVSGRLDVNVGAALPAGANAIGKLAANDGVDVGDVTINNASGASAVNVQDGGNSLTIDATTLPLPTGAATEATLLTRTKPSDQQHVIVDSSASIAVTGPLTDTQLRASAVPVSGVVSDKHDTVAAVTASWTSATTADTALALTTTGYGTAVLTLLVTGTITSGLVTFEAYDGANWVGIVAIEADLETGNNTLVSLSLLTAGTAIAYVIPAEGFAQVRARLNPIIGGSGTLALRLSASAGNRPRIGDVMTVKQGSAGLLLSTVYQALASNLNAQVVGSVAHDGVGTAVNPALVGGYASAAAPSDVSADGDAVRAWLLRNGAQVINLASGGTLITLGQKAMASSLPVVLASDQGAVPISAAALPLPSGAATEATLALLVPAQAATGIGQKGPMVMGYVSDTPGEFLSDTVQPLLLTPEGRLRVSTSPANSVPDWGSPYESAFTEVEYPTLSAWG